MKYLEIVELYDRLAGTTKRLEKAEILADFMRLHAKFGTDTSWLYLLLGRVFPEYDTRETGISRQLALKAIAYASGENEFKVQKFFTSEGDLGEVAEKFISGSKQKSLFEKEELKAMDVIETLRKISEIEGKGAVERKLDMIKGLYSRASSREALYITRTLVSDLRIGIASALVLDAIARTFFENDASARALLEEKYLMSNDIALIAGCTSVEKLSKITLQPGKPSQVMLAVKVADINEAFESCGKPAAFEQKYDGFRMLIHNAQGKISLFTRKLENVTSQFPDVVEAIQKNVYGKSFIIDSEVVGYEPKTRKYRPFEAISQRIRRKYSISELQKELPVEINVFDVLYYNGKSTMELPFQERRKLVEKIVTTKPFIIRPAIQIVTESEKEAESFYHEALDIGEEGVMIKRLDAPYRFGRYVGYMAKLKPATNDFDLVIVGAEHGTGKRAGWLTSYIVACRDGDKFVEVGRVSSGLKEKEEEGMTYEEMTKLLRKIKISEEEGIIRVEPKLVVSVTYQNIQPSPAYTSGYALRFPRITAYRPDRSTEDIASLEDMKKVFKKDK